MWGLCFLEFFWECRVVRSVVYLFSAFGSRICWGCGRGIEFFCIFWFRCCFGRYIEVFRFGGFGSGKGCFFLGLRFWFLGRFGCSYL